MLSGIIENLGLEAENYLFENKNLNIYRSREMFLEGEDVVKKLEKETEISTVRDPDREGKSSLLGFQT